MYVLRVQFKDGRKETVYKETLRDAWEYYTHFRSDSRVIRVALYAAHWIHLASHHHELGEDHITDSIMSTGGEG